jgi:hypothetical protein
MITCVFLILAAIFKAIFDTLQFHYYESIFSKLSQGWWNPEISWKNKWKDGDNTKGEKFFGSSSFLVMFTDAWHFFQHMMLACFMLSIVCYNNIFNVYIDFLIYYIIFTIIFELFFTYIFIRKK